MFFISQLPIIKYHFKWNPPLPAAISHFVFLHFTHILFGHKLFWPQTIDDAATFLVFSATFRRHIEIFFYPTGWPNSFG